MGKICEEEGLSSRYLELKKQGWLNPTFLSVLTPSEIMALFGLSDSPSIRNSIEEHLIKIKINEGVSMRFQNSSETLKTSIEEPNIIPSSLTNLNSLLDNHGFNCGDITLLYGKFRTGKSQISMQSCVNAHLKYQDNLPSKLSLFIDTEGTFRPDRIESMAKKQGLSPQAVLQKIYVVKISSVSQLQLLFSKLEEMIQGFEIKNIVIDSLTAVFRHEIAKHESEIHVIFNSFSKILKKMAVWAKKYNLTVICTSQVTASFSNMRFFNVVPILANILNTYIKQWILLGEDEFITSSADFPGRRYAHLINGQKVGEGIIQFQITPEGIQDFYLN